VQPNKLNASAAKFKVAVGGALGGIMQKIKKNESAQATRPQRFAFEFKKEAGRTQEVEMEFESKFVKELIERFNEVLQIAKQQEMEIKQFIAEGQNSESEEESSQDEPPKQQVPTKTEPPVKSKELEKPVEQKEEEFEYYDEEEEPKTE
jgi:hypothetical protein